MSATIAIARRPRMLPTTIGRSGAPAPLLARTGGRRPDLPLLEPAAAFARDLVAMRPLVEYRPDLSGLGRGRVGASVRPGPEPIGRRLPVAGLRGALHRPARLRRREGPGRRQASQHIDREIRWYGRAHQPLGQ